MGIERELNEPAEIRSLINGVVQSGKSLAVEVRENGEVTFSIPGYVTNVASKETFLEYMRIERDAGRIGNMPQSVLQAERTLVETQQEQGKAPQGPGQDEASLSGIKEILANSGVRLTASSPEGSQLSERLSGTNPNIGGPGVAPQNTERGI